MNLLEKLRAAGLTVRAESGWTTRTQTAAGYQDRPYTTCIANHWDAIQGAPPNSYYTTTNKYKGLIYHIVIRRDGTLDLLGQRIAWNAGANAQSAHNALKSGITPPAIPPGADNMSGNPYTFSVCVNYHPDFEPMTEAAYRSLVVTDGVLCQHLGLTPAQVVDHAALTRRKYDLHRGNRWPGGTINMSKLRADIQAWLEPPPIGPNPEPEPEPPDPEPDPHKENIVEDLTRGLEPQDINDLVDAGVVGPANMPAQERKDYWIGLLSQPEHVAWRRFWANLLVQTALKK